MRSTPGRPVWQRNYYEHVIRNDDEMNRIREYIINNPAGWAEDEDNPINVKRDIVTEEVSAKRGNYVHPFLKKHASR